MPPLHFGYSQYHTLPSHQTIVGLWPDHFQIARATPACVEINYDVAINILNQ